MKNIFANLPSDLRAEVFEQLLKNEQIRIERIISLGHRSPSSGWYDQQTSEWVMVLSGEAVLSFENEADVHLKVGDYINIPAHRRHRVKWTAADQPTLWLAIHY